MNQHLNQPIDGDEMATAIANRLKSEFERTGQKIKPVSRAIGAHENTLGNYVRGGMPDQWVYLAKLHQLDINIRYVLLGNDPNYAGLSHDEMELLEAYRKVSSDNQKVVVTVAQALAKNCNTLENS